MTGRRPKTFVTPHAIDRAIERFPDDFRGGRRDVVRQMFMEVERAIEQQRVSKTKPRWVVTEHGIRKKMSTVERYAWDPEERHCYVIGTERMRETGERRTVVKTVYGRYSEAWELRAAVKGPPERRR